MTSDYICSIITVCYNNREGLRQTAESVRIQTFKDYEFIVIDGGSTDGSAELLDEYSSIISYGISEKDNGIYNAMNKGVAYATGKYCLFLNSGDWFTDKDVLQRIFSQRHDEDILYGDIIRTLGRKKKIVRYPNHLTFEHFYSRSAVIHHQAAFIKRALFEKFGLYREDLYLNADWQFFFKSIALGNASTRHISTVVSVCNALGRSNTYDPNDPRLAYDRDEKLKSLRKANPNIELINTDKKDLKFYLSKCGWNLSVVVPISLFVKIGK